MELQTLLRMEGMCRPSRWCASGPPWQRQAVGPKGTGGGASGPVPSRPLPPLSSETFYHNPLLPPLHPSHRPESWSPSPPPPTQAAPMGKHMVWAEGQASLPQRSSPTTSALPVDWGGGRRVCRLWIHTDLAWAPAMPLPGCVTSVTVTVSLGLGYPLGSVERCVDLGAFPCLFKESSAGERLD